MAPFFLLWVSAALFVSSEGGTPPLPVFPAAELVYSYTSSARISREMRANLSAELVVSVCDGEQDGSQELHINVTSAQLTWTNGSVRLAMNKNPLGDLTNWFSAVRAMDGRVSSVLYSSHETFEVIAFKKSLAALLSVDGSSGSWSDEGSSVVVIQEGQTVGERTSKTTVVDRDSGAVTRVTLVEHRGTVLGQEVGSRTELNLLTQHSHSKPNCERPHNTIHDDIAITSLKRAPASLEAVLPLVSCAPYDHDCAHKLRESVRLLTDDDITTLLQQHLDEDSESFSLPQAESLLSAVSTSSPSLLTTHILTSLFLPPPPQPLPLQDLVSKLLFYLTTSLPVDNLAVERVWSLVMDRDDVILKPKALLALGAMAKRVRPSHHDLATQIVADLHHLLEKHTGHTVPLTFRKHRRSTIPALPLSLPPSSLHALLLDCLANAGAEESFPTLQHHTAFGPLSVQHAAIRSMGSYDTQESAEVLLSIADPTISGESGTSHSSLVRAARSVYQTHPRRRRDLSELPDPSSEETSTRERRDSTTNNDVMMNVTMPTVGWNRQFGDSNISVSLGRTVSNSFILDTIEQSSRYHFSFHDDTVVTSHLGVASESQETDFQMMTTQLCLEGTATYDTINILTEPTPEMTYRQFELYGEESSELVEAFESAYEQILLSNSAYNGKRDALITKLDDLINVHFEDVVAQSDNALSRLEAVSGEFYLKSVTRDIHLAIAAAITSSRDSALTSQEGVLAALEDALPARPQRLSEALLVEGQPFTTHSFHSPYLPFAPQKALVNILDVYRSAKQAYEALEVAVRTVIDLTSPNGPNHNWLAPSIRDLSDNLDTLTNDVIKAINEIPPEGSDGPHLDELNELFDVVNFDLRELLDNFVGVVNDVTTQSTELSSVLEGSRQAFSTFTLSYDTARSRVDAILGQKFHPLFPRQRRSCDHVRGCGSYPTTSGRGYGEGVALVTNDGEQELQIVAPLSGYYSQSSSTITLSPVEASYHDLTFSLSHIQPTITLTETPVFIRGGEPLGILTSEPPPQNIEGEHYIHLQLHKRVGNETYALDPTQFLQPIVRPSVALEYHCNDLITYVGGSVVDRRSLVPQTHQEVEYGEPLVDDAIPAHEFPRPVDHVLKAQGTILSGASVELLSSSTFIMVGPIPMQFDFRAVGDYQLDYSLEFSLLSREATVSLTPSLASRAQGFVRTSGVQFATVSLEGSVVEVSLPLSLWQHFQRWPLTASSQMDLVLAPTSLSLTAQLAQTTGAGEFATEEILQTDTLWNYNVPSFNRDEFYYRGSLADESPPEFVRLPYSDSDCYVRQLPVQDHQNTLFELEFSLTEPQGELSTTYQLGTAPRNDDIIGASAISGRRIVVPHWLIPASPIHVTVVVTNLGGEQSLASCSLPSFDRSSPLARITPIRPRSSHPHKISALFTLFDEFGLDTPIQVAIGTVPGDYGSDIMDWVNFDLSAISIPPTDDGEPLAQFSFKRVGRLLTEISTVTRNISTPSQCAQECLSSPGCRSFDHSPMETTCILHSGVEGPSSPSPDTENIFQTPSLQPTSDYGHYERLGVGNSTVLEFSDLSLETNTLCYINLRLVNGLGYMSTVSSTPFLVDLTPPSPGYLESVTSDELRVTQCQELAVAGLECLENSTLANHRVIVDDVGSAVVFNGLTPLVDAMFTSTSNYITANWDGLEDPQSGVLAYRWWVGSELGNDDVIPPTDPHMHLIGGQSAWTNTGLATGLDLADGIYYISVQAISNVEYGGPLVTTIHHSTPYVLDTSPPQLNDVIINDYDIMNNLLVFSYNASDEGSGLRSVSLSLGRSEHDTVILDWTGVGTAGNGTVTVSIPDGVDTWVKLRATNNAGLSSVAVAETPIRVDRTPPEVGSYGDGGNIISGDIDYQSSTNELCIHATGVTDPQSGISQILWEAGTSQGASDTVASTDVTEALLGSGVVCEEASLLHNTIYSSTLYITNAAVTSLTTTLSTNVLVDSTGPEGGAVHSGRGSGRDSRYSSDITTVTASWDGFHDYESGIAAYIVTVSLQSPDSDSHQEIYGERVDGSVSEITWTHFSFASNDSILVEVRAENGAGERTRVSSNPFIIDLSPPHLVYLVDGSDSDQDLDYLSVSDQLTVSWEARDLESQVQVAEVSVWELAEGRRLLIFPDPFVSGQSTVEVPDPTLGIYTLHDLNLGHGAKYVTVLTLRNGAGLVSEYESSGVVVDLTPPEVTRVEVEGVLIAGGETRSVELTVTGTDRLSVRWSAVDIESGVFEILVGVVNENDSFVTPSLARYEGQSSGGVVEGLGLGVGGLYRVAVVAVSNAGTESERVYSRQFRVVAGNVPGRVYDGEDPDLIDVDYTDEATAVTAHFEGFPSSDCGGFSRFEWAIGEGWERDQQDTVMSFTDRGVVVDPATGSGYAQALLPGLAEYGARPLFVSVRATTNCGDAILSTSNGFLVDPSPPTLEVIGTGENAIERAQNAYGSSSINHTTYQTTPSFSSLWQLTDDQSGPESAAVVQIGSYPGGGDILGETIIEGGSVRGSLNEGAEGLPHYVTVTGYNRAGLPATASGRAVVLDTSPPSLGELTCSITGFPPPLPLSPSTLSLTPSLVECQWSSINDPQSGVREVTLSISQENHIIFNTTLPGTETDVRTSPLLINLSSTYQATLEATNGAGLSRVVETVFGLHTESEVVYGGLVSVTVNYARTENVSGVFEEPERVSGGEDFVCLLETDVISIEFPAPLDDQSVETSSFEVGVGYFPGTDDCLTFTSFTPSPLTTDTYSHTLTHFDARSVGRRPIYVTVQALSSQNPRQFFKLTSPPIYIKSDIGEWDSRLVDGTDPIADVEYQTSTTEIAAHLSISSHCLISYVRWSIEDTSGTVVNDYLDLEIPPHSGREVENEFSLFTDRVKLYNEETYRVLVQASDATGEVFILRSNGVTVTTDELVPGYVWDGPNPDEDLSYQEPTDYLLVQWTDFGDGTPEQEVAYYEVAAGSNMGHPNTRTDIAPFTNVGLNTTHTFRHLDLVPETILYVITVRATAVSGAISEVSSNGIRVGHTHTISPGSIFLSPFSSSSSKISVHWEEFQSNVPIRSYEWAVGEVHLTSEQLENVCADYLSAFEDTFEVLPFTSVGLGTSSFLVGLNLTANTSYHVTIRATDEANKCLAVTSSGMLVDLTPPTSPSQTLTLGPSESLIGIGDNSQHIVFIQSGQDLSVRWEDFIDGESGIASYEVALFEQGVCGSHDLLVAVTDYIVTGLEKYFVFEAPSLQQEVAYVVEVRATNLAGLSEGVFSEPVLVDRTDVVPGTVRDGLYWDNDVVFQSNLSTLSGIFSHAKLAPRYPGVVFQNDPCPNTTYYSLSEESEAWNHLSPTTITGIDSTTIQYSPAQANISAVGLTISAQYNEGGGILTGAYQTEADLSLGGVASLDIQAAVGSRTEDRQLQEQSVTSVVFTDTSAPSILADFEFESRDSNSPSALDIRAVGVQVHHRFSDVEQKVVLWAKTGTPLVPVVYVAHDIPGIDLSQVHKYTLHFQSGQRDTDTQRWVDLYIDDQLAATLHAIPALSNTTRLTLHVFNRNGFVPQFQDNFSPPRVEAVFANVTLPRKKIHLCDFGRPFYSASSPIVEFSAGVGSSPGLTDILELQLLATPCRPCTPGPCSGYGCSQNCTSLDPYTLPFTLTNLSLSPGYHTNQSDASSGDFEFESSNTPSTLLSLFSDHFQPAIYYLTVQAVTASGRFITASSNGVSIDTSPPVAAAPIDHFDVTFSSVQPSDFQGSNDTISVRWVFVDTESGVVDYQWGIGTSPNTTDIQPLVSVGVETSGINRDLLGVLKHNETYYVTVVAKNGAGLSASLTSDGVTYSASELNSTALEEVVEIEFDRRLAVVGEGEIVVVEQGDRAAIMWDGVSDDVEDIFWYIGTEPESQDVLPRTEVSFNESRKAEFEGGVLYLNGAAFANISELVGQSEGRTQTAHFVLEPGRLVFNTLELCNFVHRCVAVLPSPSILIRSYDGEVTAEAEETDLQVTINQIGGQSAEVTDRDYTITMATTGGVEPGTVMAAGFLSHSDLHQYYRATSPYISNPYTTMTQTSPEIARRFAEVAGPSFYVSFLGQDSLNGPLTINVTFDPSLNREAVFVDVFYWDRSEEVWREVNATCGAASTVDWSTFTISAQMCSAEVESGLLRGRRQTASGSGSGGATQSYLSGPVQFIVVGIGNTSANTPPELQLPAEPLSLVEGTSLSDYQLHYLDMEGDEVEFYLISPPRLGNVSLTLDGLLSYSPCTYCTGVDSFEIFIVEKPFGFNNVPLTASGMLVVEIENVNNAPFLYAFDPDSERETDITTSSAVDVVVESNRSSAVSIAQIVALDLDGYFDDITISTQDGEYGEAGVDIWLDIVSVLESLPVSSLPDDTFLGYISLVAANITYFPSSPDFTGSDVVRVIARDKNSGLSNSLTINIEVVPSLCLNNGVCNGSVSDATCEDVESRRTSPETYTCRCTEGYSGRHCELDTRAPAPVDTRECLDGVPVVTCDGDPCTDAVCPSNGSAVCRPNYCGSCRAEWFVGDTPIQCNADDPLVCLKPTEGPECFLSGITSCECPSQPYPCPPDSVFVETRSSECCVTFECLCPDISCPLLMEGDLGVQPVPEYRGNRFPGRCCPLYSFEDIDECESSRGNMCSDVCVNHETGYSCQCHTGKTLSQNRQSCGVCRYDGREYLLGDRVEIGCNWCICESDAVSGERWRCTADHCEPSCIHNGVLYQVGETLAIPLDRALCACEATDVYADWRCEVL